MMEERKKREESESWRVNRGIVSRKYRERPKTEK